MSKNLIIMSIVSLLIASGADAGTGGNGGGNPKNDASWNTKEPIKRYIWDKGKLVPNPDRERSLKKDVEGQVPATK